MKIYHLKHKEIDKKKWDMMIAASRNRLPYAFSWYLDIVSRHWEALATAEYEYIFPLTGSRKYGIPYLRQPFFAQQLGIFSVYEITEGDVRQFLERIPLKYRYVDIQLNTANRLIGISGFKMKSRSTHFLALSLPHRELRKNYRSGRISDIKKATKRGVHIQVNINLDLALGFYYETLVKHLKDAGPKEMQLLQKVVLALASRDMARLYAGYNGNGKLISIAFFIVDREYCIYLFGASDAEGKKYGANSFLLDRMIKDFAATPKILDFEGSEIPSVADFFKSFGSEEILYLQIRANKLPILLRWFKE